ncbi:hypothetical protein V8E51_018700 [Hyaloscypha variabilis]
MASSSKEDTLRQWGFDKKGWSRVFPKDKEMSKFPLLENKGWAQSLAGGSTILPKWDPRRRDGRLSLLEGDKIPSKRGSGKRGWNASLPEYEDVFKKWEKEKEEREGVSRNKKFSLEKLGRRLYPWVPPSSGKGEKSTVPPKKPNYSSEKTTSTSELAFDPKRKLTRGSHTLVDLARLAVRNSQNRGARLTSLQQQALRAFRNVGIVPDETSTRQIIRIYEPIFDKLFFLGSLEGKLSITATGDPATRSDEKIHGMAFPATDGADIELNIHGEGGQQRILQHVATLLHEMIHAFFMVYMLPKYYREKTFRSYGYDGHGQYWHDIAYAL